MIVRYARDLRMDDLRMGNAVLIGSVESDPWIQIFESQIELPPEGQHGPANSLRLSQHAPASG